MKIRSDQTLILDLREFIAALDRRLPGLEVHGEQAIARDAAALRVQALKRITELERLRGARRVGAMARRTADATPE